MPAFRTPPGDCFSMYCGPKKFVNNLLVRQILVMQLSK